MTKFLIKLNSRGKNEIWVDDKDITLSCNSVTLDCLAGAPPELLLGLTGEIEIEGEATVKLQLPNNRIFTVKSEG